MNRIKLFTFISILCLFIIVPTSFAADGADAVDVPVENLTAVSDANILTADYYFDSNVADDTSSENEHGNMVFQFNYSSCEW